MKWTRSTVILRTHEELSGPPAPKMIILLDRQREAIFVVFCLFEARHYQRHVTSSAIHQGQKIMTTSLCWS
jgi:hypothetical protein